jgi:hypothetical protein
MSSIVVNREDMVEMVQRCNDLQRDNDELRAEVARLTAGILEARKAFNGEGSHSWDDGMVTLCALIGVSVLEHNPTPRTLAEMVGENRAFRAALAGEVEE